MSSVRKRFFFKFFSIGTHDPVWKKICQYKISIINYRPFDTACVYDLCSRFLLVVIYIYKYYIFSNREKGEKTCLNRVYFFYYLGMHININLLLGFISHYYSRTRIWRLVKNCSIVCCITYCYESN